MLRALLLACHRIGERSFLWLWDPPLLCARCTGIAAGVLAGAVLGTVIRTSRRSRLLAVVLALLANAVTAGEIFPASNLGNWVRFAAGAALGATCGFSASSSARRVFGCGRGRSAGQPEDTKVLKTNS